jgi:hypothetical protein
MDAILRGHLDCESLSLDKYYGDDRVEASLHIRYWLDDVHACINGRNFDRKLLKHAHIDRSAFQEWCEKRNIPLPEFWFPVGWNIEYKWSDEDVVTEENTDSKGLRPSQKACIATQQIASAIWKEEPTRTIASICKDELVLKFGGGRHYEEETVKSWVKAVAPAEVSQKRGRPSKKNHAGDE